MNTTQLPEPPKYVTIYPIGDGMQSGLLLDQLVAQACEVTDGQRVPTSKFDECAYINAAYMVEHLKVMIAKQKAQ